MHSASTQHITEVCRVPTRQTSVICCKKIKDNHNSMNSVSRFPHILRRAGALSWVRRRSMKAAVASDVDIRGARPFEEIPGPPAIYNIPFIGSMLHFKPFTDITMETMPRLLNSLVAKYGSLVRVRLGEWAVLVEDPADIEVVMRNEGKYPKRKILPLHSMYCETTGFPKGLAASDGEEWQTFRSPVNPRMMRAKSAQHYLPVQNEVADDLVKLMKKGVTPEQLVDIFYRYACESISVVAYNKRLGYLDPDIGHYPEKLQALDDSRAVFRFLRNSMQIPEAFQRYLPLKMKRQYTEVINRLIKQSNEHYNTVMDEIKKKQEEGTLDIEEHNFMLSLLMTDKLTTQHMTAISLDLFVAGTDSTAKNLQMVLYNLARNPDKQQKLYEEIVGILGPHGPLTEETQSKMTYLLACVRESFRLIFPVMTGPTRYMPTDIVLQGYRIPAGTTVWLMNQVTLKNEKYFPNPDSYIPERWFRSKGGKRADPIPPAAYLPFGFGPRQCVGKRFAEQEIYLALVKILQQFHISLEPGHGEVEPIYSLFVDTKEPIRFVLKERNK